MRLVETASQQDHGRGSPVLRRKPTLSWTDSRGAQSFVVGDRALLGAAADVEVLIADATVSRLHAEVELRAEGLWVRDLGSRNGTYVDGVRVESALLADKAHLRLGAVELRIAYARKPAPVDAWPDASFGPLVGGSGIMRQLYARLARAAATESTVLLQGETGTGKELVARALHEASPRAGSPLVIIDCAALPETLLESELFGHAKGAFTGAVNARPGAIESADGGTVFLDEIGELPLGMQPKLLRILETRMVRRLGETQGRAVNVRFVSATHRDLRSMVNARAFREDLFFRLSVLPVVVPPLRDRAEDIPLLARHFLGESACEAMITPPLMRDLEGRPWLGNVRELRNVLERVVAFGAAEALTTTLYGVQTHEPVPAPQRGMIPTADLLTRSYREAREVCIDRFEREYVQELLAKHGRNVTAAADAAGINRTYLHRLVRRHGL